MPTDSTTRKRDEGPPAVWSDPTCGVCSELLVNNSDGFECANCQATYTTGLEFAGWADGDEQPQCESRAACREARS